MTVSLKNADRPHIASFILLAVQLGLLLLVADKFLIEQTYGFSKLIPIIFVGFVIHAWLPHRWRAQFFLLLFPIGAFSLLGVIAGTALIGLGVVLFLLCHLPFSTTVRTAILISVGGILAAVRAGAIELPVSIPAVQMYLQTQTLPILSAMFMFRTIIYLYDLRHEKAPVSYWQRLGYFFMFPNVCFPLFPVVDYQTYKRTYFDRASYEIYQKGIDWILRGITHLLLYRIVYHYFVPDPLSVDSFTEVGQYVFSSFLLYLRVSGLFHLIIGVLCLFGYNLPETHHRYYLSDSFTDFWRRINIYWKDFMMKLFYYPIFLRLRGWGMTRAMITATLITFIITWALHSYQWFWLRGAYPLHGQDMIFWGILAVLVTANSLYEEKYGRKRRQLTKNFVLSPREALKRSMKGAIVFVVICLLWSFWTSGSVEQWLAVMSVIADAGMQEWLSFIALWALVVAIGVAVQLYGDRRPHTAADRPFSIPRRTVWVGGAAVVLLAIANPGVSGRLDSRAGNLVATITGDQLNTRDQQRLVKGYYEEMLGVESSGAMAWSVRLEKPDDWDWNGEATILHAKNTGDIRGSVFLPGVTGTHKGRAFITNQWGFRGAEIEKSKPPGTYRIAMLGSSYTLGAGIDVELTFPSVVRDQLNDTNKDIDSAKFELLNFSFGDDSILRRFSRLEKQALDFDIDLIIDMAMTDEIHLAIRNVRAAIKNPTADIEPFLLDVARRAGATAEMSNDEIERRLRPYGEEICIWGYQQLARIAKQNKIHTVVFMLPRTNDSDSNYAKELEILSRMAGEAGFPIIGLAGVYGPLSDRNNLKLAPWDWHPNAMGHELLGRRIYQELVELDFMRFVAAGGGNKTIRITNELQTNRK